MTDDAPRTLTEADLQALRSAVHGDLTPAEHAEHHAAIRLWIERENKRAYEAWVALGTL